MLDADGSLDRGALAAVVFSDPQARRDLEQIVHPAVYAAIQAWLEEPPRGTRLAVADIPLLFETGHQVDFDRVVVVACPPDEQLRRVMSRDGISEAEARTRLDAQWPIADKVVLADEVIWTTARVPRRSGKSNSFSAGWWPAHALTPLLNRQPSIANLQ